MAIPLSDNIKTNAPKPNDNRYFNNLRPWASINAANSGITRALRYSGLTVNVGGVEHWYKHGIRNNDLIPKANNLITENKTIYVETTGSDSTGDGTSVGTAFATLEKAILSLSDSLISGCIVVIQLGEGNFEVSENCTINMVRVHSVNGGNVQIAGTVEYISEINLTPIDYQAGRYSIDEGIPSENYYYDYFLWRDTGRTNNKYPIAKHDTSEIRINSSTELSGATNLFMFKTTLTGKRLQIGENIIGTPLNSNTLLLQLGSSSVNYTTANSPTGFPLTYYHLKVETENGFIGIGALHPINFQSCLVRPSDNYPSTGSTTLINSNLNGISGLINFGFSVIDISDCSRLTWLLYGYNSEQFTYTRLIGTFAQEGIGLMKTPTDYNINTIFEGFQTGLQNRYYVSEYVINNSRKLKFLDCNYCFRWRGGTLRAGMYYGSEIVIYNCNYLMFNTNNDFLHIYLPRIAIVGDPVIDWVYPYLDVTDNWYNPALQQDVVLPDLFREIDVITNTTITDNDTTYIIVGDTGQTRSVTLEYSLIRDTGYETGTIKLLYDGTNIYYTDSGILNNSVDLGVTFNADINSNEIRLMLTTTSTGTDASFKANVRRLMI